MLIRASYCPGVICNIISEPVLVYQEKCSITFGGDGRVITMADGKRLCLSMTSNGLGWLKSDPITDDVTVLDMLDRKGDMVTSISTRLSTPITNVDDANLLEADDGDAQIEEIASSNNMYHLLDPILARCTSDVALALRQPLVASVGIDTISAPIDESIDISVDYAHLECEEIDQSISTALKDARLQYINCLSMDRKMRFVNPSIDTILAKRQVLVCQQKMDELRAKVPSFIMDIFAKRALTSSAHTL